MVCHGAVALLPWELRAVTVNVYSRLSSSSVTRYGDVTFCNNHQRSPHLSCHKHPGLRITNISSTSSLFVHLTTTTQMSFVCVLASFWVWLCSSAISRDPRGVIHSVLGKPSYLKYFTIISPHYALKTRRFLESRSEITYIFMNPKSQCETDLVVIFQPRVLLNSKICTLDNKWLVSRNSRQWILWNNKFQPQAVLMRLLS